MKTQTTPRTARAASPQKSSARWLVAAAIAAVMTASCDVHSPSGPGSIASLTISPDVTMLAQATHQFTAVATDADGREIEATPTWSVVAGGGTISGTGLFTAGPTPGTFVGTVQATNGGVTASVSVVVTFGEMATISVTPNPVTMEINSSQQFTAEGFDGNGNVVHLSGLGTESSTDWQIVNGGGTLDNSGLFTAGTELGTFNNTIRGSHNGVAGFVTVTVIAGPLANITVSPDPDTLYANGSRQFIAEAVDAGGNTLTVSPVWSVTNGGGTISGTGLFTAGPDTGTFENTVTATSASISGSATVTVIAAAPPSGFFGAAEPNGIMAGTEVTCITGGTISADVSIHPGNTISGFGPCVITGTQNLGNAIAEQAQIDLTTAYNTLAGLPCPPANVIAADLGGTTQTAGVYCSATGIGVTGALTLDGGGDPDAVFVFQAGSELTTAGDIVLINGAQARNVYWQVGSSATLGTASQWQGNILALTSITLVDNANLLGRALARNGAVTLGTGNTITLP